MSVDTSYLNNLVNNMTDVEQVIEFCSTHENELIDVSKVLNALISHYNMSISQFIKTCDLSRNNKSNVYGWFDGTCEPQRRTNYIKIAIGLHMNLQEADRLLVRVGGYGRLYPKNIQDAAYIHILQKRGNHSDYKKLIRRMEHELEECVLHEACSRIADFALNEKQRERFADYIRLRNEIPQTWDDEYYKKIDALDKEYKSELSNIRIALRKELMKSDFEPASTETMMKWLNDNDDMVEYVRENWKEFLTRNWRLCAHLDSLMKHHSYINDYGKKVNSIVLLADDAVDKDIIRSTAVPIVKKAYRGLYSEGKTMSRNMVILLGLLLEQDVEGINIMLDMAGLDLLCVKRESEAALIFALNQNEQSPYVRDAQGKISDIKDELLEFTLSRRRKMESIVKLLFTEDELENDFI